MVPRFTEYLSELNPCISTICLPGTQYHYHYFIKEEMTVPKNQIAHSGLVQGQIALTHSPDYKMLQRQEHRQHEQVPALWKAHWERGCPASAGLRSQTSGIGWSTLWEQNWRLSCWRRQSSESGPSGIPGTTQCPAGSHECPPDQRSSSFELLQHNREGIDLGMSFHPLHFPRHP